MTLVRKESFLPGKTPSGLNEVTAIKWLHKYQEHSFLTYSVCVMNI